MADSADAAAKPKQTDTSISEEANELKGKGNDAFKAGDFDRAIEFYSKAIEVESTPVLLSNRAFAWLKQEAFGKAMADADAAIAADRTYVKAYYRKASAFLGLGQFKKARKQFRTVLKLAPKNADAKKKLAMCDAEVSRQAFEEAIQTERGRPIAETLDLDSITVDASYEGPRLEGEITLEFVQDMMKWFKQQKMIHRKYAMDLLLRFRKLVAALPSLVRVSVPADGRLTVCGDTHGQYYDTLNIFDNINGFPSPTNAYMFNGDFVDRGSFSVENVLTLFALKVLYPDSVHLSRGNHESKNLNKMYGFEGEVQAKLDSTTMALFSDVFQQLPLAHVIEDKIFVTHGGLPTGEVTLEDIAQVERRQEPPDSGIMSDLMWADPMPTPGTAPSKRGISHSFGPDVTQAFLRHNNLELVIRSHEVRQEGFEVEHGGQLVTVFSAPNYCDQMGNKGGLIRITPDLKRELVAFDAVPHPPVRPMQYSRMGMFGL